jgi:3-oxoacyl-[acyl-carrier protein] reductase
MNIAFPGQVVIVTGGAHGLGRAISHAFAARGARTWTCDILADGLAETAAEASPAAGGSLETAVVDVTDRAAVGQFVDGIARATGRIDVLVNNAGGVCGQVGRPIEDVTQDDWRAIFDVNVHASFHCAQAVAPHMKAARAGRIVHISSGAGLGVSLTGIQAYASAKAAQIGLTRQLAHELGPFGITVNSIAPGFVRSNPTTEGQQRLIDRIALRRLGAPADIAHAVLFLASEYAAWITGQVVPVNGGA